MKHTDRAAGLAPQWKACKLPSDPELLKYMQLFPEEMVDKVDCIVRADGGDFPSHALV